MSGSTPVSEFGEGAPAQNFRREAVQSAANSASQTYDLPCDVLFEQNWSDVLSGWVSSEKLSCIVTARTPVGPIADHLAQATQSLNIPVIQMTRSYDQTVWPFAKRGFFGLKKKIPQILEDLGLS